jgi:polyphosphate kinase
MKQGPEEHREARGGALQGMASATGAAGARPIAETMRSRRAGAPAPVADGGAQVDRSPGGHPLSDGGAPGAEALSPPLASATDVPPPRDLRAPQLYLNRELTWLSFNSRVLHEAQDPRTPLLERVKFLAIANANLDEFFMKRIGGLKQQVGAGVKDLTVDGRTPEQQIDECVTFVRAFTGELRATYLDLLDALRQHDTVLCAWEDLSGAQQKALRTHYLDNVFPLVTPLAMDPAHPFPFISNLSLNLLVTLSHPDDQYPILARVKVPIGSGVPRFLKVGERNHFVRLEDVMAHNLDALFPGMQVQSCEFFRVTRNANTEQDEEEADDLLAMIEAELRDRRFAPIVRLEIAQGMNPVHRGMLAVELGLREDQDVFEIAMPLGLTDLFEIVSIDDPALHDPPHHPVTNGKLEDERNIFHIIRETGPILLQHPYESFGTSVERFVHEASRDPHVLAIKMTLYRTSASTRIIDDLIEASRNGKQVAVVVEIKARFDEAANIQWANRLERTGIHVMYGVVGLKTHSKVILVVRRDFNRLRRYAHIGTGNYHAGTARIYSDLGLFTCDDEVGRDLIELFNYLTTGYKPSRSYQKILAAPRALKQPLLDKIEREIGLHSPASPGLIRFKSNALEDSDIVEALYRAAQRGVIVELIVRDTCRLRPGLPGLSETVTVVSIVGRFLEHARIYYFRNGGDEEFFIGSADLMKRNLESRVEVVTPVLDPALREELRFILDTQLDDRRSAWEMRADGSYVQRQPRDEAEAIGSQQVLIAAAEKRYFEASRLRKRKPRSIARRQSEATV